MLIFFLYDIRSGLIVAITIPLSLLFAFICLDLRHIPANLLSIGAIDFGILVDGAVVMVENIYRQLATRDTARRTRSRDVIVDAAAEVDRPIVYAVARDRRELPADLRAVRSVGQAVSSRWPTRRSSRSSAR